MRANHRLFAVAILLILNGCILLRNEAKWESFYYIDHMVKEERSGKMENPNTWWGGYFGRTKTDPELSPQEVIEVIEYAKKLRLKAGLPPIEP